MTKPNGDRIIVKPISNDTITDSGLLITSKIESNTLTGTVISVGPGRKTKTGVLIPMQVTEGDVIIYASGSGVKSKLGTLDVLIISEADVLGIKLED